MTFFQGCSALPKAGMTIVAGHRFQEVKETKDIQIFVSGSNIIKPDSIADHIPK